MNEGTDADWQLVLAVGVGIGLTVTVVTLLNLDLIPGVILAALLGGLASFAGRAALDRL